MTGVHWPPGYRLERLERRHSRKSFRSGEAAVDDWLLTKSLQNQAKNLSVTRVVLNGANSVRGYYTLATGQVDFGDLPAELARGLPRRPLPVAILAWLGVDRDRRRLGLGTRLLAQALRDCWDASQVIPLIGVIIDCLSVDAKRFFQQWNFRELPGHPMRLFLSAKDLDEHMASSPKSE